LIGMEVSIRRPHDLPRFEGKAVRVIRGAE
jgi:hypothetical protein